MNSYIKELATKLAINQIDVSLRVNEPNDPFGKILLNPINRKLLPRSRIIFVIGAGASKNANSNLNTAEKVANVLQNTLVGDNPAIKQLIEEEITRLSNIYALKSTDFETKLLAFIKFFPKKVRSEIREIFHDDFRFFPNLFYEIVAHLFKHRFIDVIINFNFDELLDQVILEEMADSEYHHIFSDGECPPEDDLLIDDRFKKPIYIKPHGTSSHPSTLRFTREAYEELPQDIYKLIKYLIRGEVNNVNIEGGIIPVNLISVGFAMESFEFNHIITGNVDWNTSYYHINKEKFKTNNRELENRLDVKHIQISEKLTLDKMAIHLWKNTVSCFKKIFEPKGIERHLIVNDLFITEKDKDRPVPQRIRYAKDRIFFEIFIALLNNEGTVSLEHLINGRTGIYYNLYKKLYNDGDSIHRFLEKMGATKYQSNIKTTYILENDVCNRFDFHDLFDTMYSNLTNTVEDFGRKLILKKGATYRNINKLSKKIFDSNLKNITPKFKNPHHELFEEIDSSHVINTNLLWSYRFRELLERNNEWDLLLVISETGGVVVNDYNRNYFKNKRVGLIIASERNRRDYSEINLLGGKPRELPWWIHNRHMVLFIQTKVSGKVNNWKDKWKLYRGIYFTSRFSNRVNPVYIKGEKDKEAMLNIYGRYWLRSESYNPNEEKPTIRIIKSGKEIDETLTRIANLY